MVTIYSVRITPDTIKNFLLCMGVLATLAVLIGLLLFVGYLLNLLFLSIGEIAGVFNTFDPLVRLLVLSLCTVLIAWRFSSLLKVRYSGYGH